MDTQTDTQVTSQAFSQAMENQIPRAWGRLVSKISTVSSLDVTKESFKIGRDDGQIVNNDHVITEKEIQLKILSRLSKTHFRIERDLTTDSNPAIIYDESRNGTFVNGRLLGTGKKRILCHDDVIALAHDKYKFYKFLDIERQSTTKIPNEILKKYFVSKQLGSGACGVVKLIYDVHTMVPYALKTVEKHQMIGIIGKNHTSNERINNEVRIMKELKHPCVISMHDIVETPDAMHMILEYMKGGDLLHRILKCPNKCLTESTGKLLFYQIVHAVKYLHTKGITHRDLKPDNILLADDNEETLVKVSDFGLSKVFGNNSVLKTLCGTPVYVAPEILETRGRGIYTALVDVWSMGVVLFTMLSGTIPFSDEYGSQASEQIKKGVFTFRHQNWKKVSSNAKDLIRRILKTDPNKRLTLDEILDHSWLQDPKMITKAEELTKTKLSAKSNSDIENDESLFKGPPAKKDENEISVMECE